MANKDALIVPPNLFSLSLLPEIFLIKLFLDMMLVLPQQMFREEKLSIFIKMKTFITLWMGNHMSSFQ